MARTLLSVPANANSKVFKRFPKLPFMAAVSYSFMPSMSLVCNRLTSSNRFIFD